MKNLQQREKTTNSAQRAQMKAKLKMISVMNKRSAGFTLIEVLITVAILSTAIIFLFRSFTASLSAAQFSQNLTLACYLAEEKFFDIQNSYAYKKMLMDEGTQSAQNINFRWKYEIGNTDNESLKKLGLFVSWKEKVKAREYSVDFSTLLPKAE